MATQAELAKEYFFKDNKGWAAEFDEMQRGLRMDPDDPMWWFIYQQFGPRGDSGPENRLLNGFAESVKKLGDIKQSIADGLSTIDDGQRRTQNLIDTYKKMDGEAELLQHSIQKAMDIYGKEPPEDHLARFIVDHISNRRLLIFLGAIPVTMIVLGVIEWLVITHA